MGREVPRLDEEREGQLRGLSDLEIEIWMDLH